MHIQRRHVPAALDANAGALPFSQLKEVLRTAHQYSTQFIAMPRAVWNDLSAADRQLLQAADMTVVRDIDQASMAQGRTQAMAHISAIYAAEAIAQVRKLIA